MANAIKFHLEYFSSRQELDAKLKELGFTVKRWRLFNSRGNPLNSRLYICKRVKDTTDEYYLSYPEQE